THTREDTRNPWWEVDLRAEVPIASVVIYNRTDGGHGTRLQGFTFQILNQDRSVVFEKKDNPAPSVKAVIEVGGGNPERVIRRAAMTALTSVRGREEQTVKALAPFLKDGADRTAAVQALLRVPVRYWPKDEARPVLDGILAYVRKVPARDRTAPAVLDAMQLA